MCMCVCLCVCVCVCFNSQLSFTCGRATQVNGARNNAMYNHWLR